METRRIYKQGKSLVVVIPSKYAEALQWTSGTDVSVLLQPDNSIKIKSLQPYNQLELLRPITKPYTHGD